MLKKLFVGLVPAAIITTTGLCALPAQSTTTTTVVSTPRQFCEYFNQYVPDEQFLEDCSVYSDEVGAPLNTDKIHRLDEGQDLTLKDMNFTYTSIRSPFALWDGKLTIDGGTYRTADACFFSLGYNAETGKTNYDGLTIISGDFIAEGKNGDPAKSPICLVPSEEATNEEAEGWLKLSLGPSSYYTEYGTENKIDIETELLDGVSGMGKNRSEEMTKIKEFSSNKISVRVIMPEEKKAPVEEEQEEPQDEETTEERKEEEKDTVLPKAPNTGVGKM
jgi:hypothetical protein